MYDGWLDDLADQGYTDEQIQGIRQWAQTQEDDRLLAYAEALEEAGWTVTPPAATFAAECEEFGCHDDNFTGGAV